MALDFAFFSNTGSDESGTGTQLNPYATPKKAVENLNPGGKALGRGGVYTGIRGTNDANDTFKQIPSGFGAAYGDDYTTVGAFNNEPVEFISHMDAATMILMPALYTKIRFQDLILTGNPNPGNTASQACFTGNAAPNNGSFLDILRCEIRTFRGVVIQTASAPDGRLLDCSMHDFVQSNSGNGGAYAIYSQSGAHRWEIGRNAMFNIDSTAIHHYSSSGEASNLLIHDNLIYNVCRVDNAGGAVLVANGTGHLIWNNIVFDVGALGSGFQVEYAQTGGTDTRNSIWAHNIAYLCEGYGFDFTQNGTGNLVINNIALSNGSGPIRNLEGAALTTNLFSGVTPESIWVDPGAAKNFHLLPGAAAARGQGTYNANFPTDKDGVTRAPGATDIGPSQYATAPVARRSKDPRIYAIGWF